jgi:hypothetical protein
LRKRRLLPAGFLVFLSVGLLASAPGGFLGKTQDQGQPEWPKFYAIRVVSEKNVLNAKDSLGAPDGRYAEILPGGQLVLQMEKGFCLFVFGWNQEGVEMISGSVVGKGGADIGLEVWSPWQETEGKYYYGWVPVGLSAKGFSIPIDIFGLSFDPKGNSPPFIGNTGVNTVRITNLGTKSLFVDAVIGLDREVERK